MRLNNTTILSMVLGWYGFDFVSYLFHSPLQKTISQSSIAFVIFLCLWAIGEAIWDSARKK